MADESRFTVKNFKLFGEFLSNLKIVNFYINLNEQCEGYSVSKLQFEHQKVKIELENRANPDDKNEDALEFNLPPKIKLIPQSISGIKPAVNGWIFRLSFEENDDTITSNVWEHNLHPKCSKCLNQLLVNSPEYASGLMIVNERTIPSYFCHKHDHGGNDHDEFTPPDVLIPSEALNDELNYIIHSKAINQDSVTIAPNETVRCSRCLAELGTKNHEEFRLYKEAVNTNYLNYIIRQCPNGRKIFIKSKSDVTCVLLWPMDITFMISSSSPSNEVVTGRKVLYKLCKEEDIKVTNSVEVTSITDLANELINSSLKLPLTWQFVNDYNAGLVST
ncbi:hypothetical protein CHUAL_003080 [Chamberlinius hualienensis]